VIPKILKNKKFLTFAVIILLLSLILPLSAYIYKNVITKPPVIHSVVRFDSKVEQTISPGDTLEGKGIENAKATVSITPNGISEEVNVDKDGKWSLEIPRNLQPKNYNLTISINDVLGNIASIKSYKIIIPASTSVIPTSFSVILSEAKNLLRMQPIKPAYAQGTNSPSNPSCTPVIQKNCNGQCIPQFQSCTSQPQPTPLPSSQQPPSSDNEYALWEQQMRSFDIYPALENGEIVLYNYETYRDKYCQQGCIFGPGNPQVLVNNASTSPQLLTRLIYKLRDDGYAPITTLEAYFPNIREITGFRRRTFEIQGLPPDIDGGPLISGKTEIDAATLSQYIQQIYNELGWRSAIFNQNFGDPIKTLITLTDPIFGTRAFVDIITLPPNQVSDETRLNALLGLSFIFGVSEKVALGGMKIGADGLINFPNMLSDVRGIKNSIRSLRPGEQPIPLSTVRQQAQTNIWVSTFRQIRAQDNIFPILTGLSARQIPHAIAAKELVEQGKAFVLDLGLTRPIMTDLIDRFENWAVTNRRRINVDRNKIMRIIDNHLVVVVKNIDDFHKVCVNNTGGGGCAGSGAVFLYGDFDETGGLIHEFVHQIMYANVKYARGGRNFYTAYGVPEANAIQDKHTLLFNYSTLMTYFMEQGTDFTVNRLFSEIGYRSSYQSTQPEIYRAITTLIERINSRCSNCLTSDDFIEFAITLDDEVLMRKIIPYMSPNEFMTIVERTLDINLLSSFMKAYVVRAESRYEQYLVPAAAAGATGLGLVQFITVHSAIMNWINGLDIPDNTTIILEPIDIEDADILLDDDGEVTISSVEDNNESQSKVTAHVLETSSGILTDEDEEEKLKEIWALEPVLAQTGLIKSAYAQENNLTLDQIQALPATEISPQTYEITFPDIPDGEYKLTAYLYKEGSKEILDSDFEVISIGVSSSENVSDANNPLIPDFIEEPFESILEQITEIFETEPTPTPSLPEDEEELTPVEEPELFPSVAPQISLEPGDFEEPELTLTPPALPPSVSPTPTPTPEPQGFEDIVLPTQTQEYSQISPSPSPTEIPDLEPTELEPTTQPVKQILRVLVNNEEQSIADIQSGGIDFELPLNEGQPNQSIQIPVQVVFNDGSSKYLVYTFNYLTQDVETTAVQPEPTEASQVLSPTPHADNFEPEPTDIPDTSVPTSVPAGQPEPTDVPYFAPEPTPEPIICYLPFIRNLFNECEEPEVTPEPTNIPEPTYEPEPTDEPVDTPVPAQPQKQLTEVRLNGQYIDKYALQAQGVNYTLPISSVQPGSYNVTLSLFYDDGSANSVQYLFNYTPSTTYSYPSPSTGCVDSDGDGICDSGDNCDFVDEDIDNCQDFDGCPDPPSACQTPTYGYPTPGSISPTDQCQYDSDFSTLVSDPNTCFCIGSQKWATYMCDNNSSPEYANYPVDPWDCTDYTCPGATDQCVNDDDFDQFVPGTCWCNSGEEWATFECSLNNPPEYGNYPAYPGQCSGICE